MPLNLDAIGTTSDPVERSWNSKDALLYAVGVGAGASPLDELEFTTENSNNVDQKVLPTFGVVLAMGAGAGMRSIGSFNPAMLVHAEQSIRFHQPLRPEGMLRMTGKLADIEDKGSGALVSSEAEAVDAATGDPVFTTRSGAFIRGEGGFGARATSSAAVHAIPDREPDHVVSYDTLAQQALIYRLNGDRNPLHSDPSFAAMAGFDRPILHGLCTYGFTGRALLHALCGSDPARFISMYGRFSKPVMPGDTLTIKMWRDSDDAAASFQTVVNGAVVIDRGRCEYR